MPGHLWLWLDHQMSVALDAKAFDLALDENHIERLARLYQPYGQEVTEIIFFGNERSRLNESMERIITFFRLLQEEVIDG